MEMYLQSSFPIHWHVKELFLSLDLFYLKAVSHFFSFRAKISLTLWWLAFVERSRGREGRKRKLGPSITYSLCFRSRPRRQIARNSARWLGPFCPFEISNEFKVTLALLVKTNGVWKKLGLLGNVRALMAKTLMTPFGPLWSFIAWETTAKKTNKKFHSLTVLLKKKFSLN